MDVNLKFYNDPPVKEYRYFSGNDTLNLLMTNLAKAQVDLIKKCIIKVGIVDEDYARSLYQAFKKIPREDFLSGDVYGEEKISLGFNQYAESFYELVRVLSLLGIQKNSRVLEIGTGSGYSTAIMESLGATVFSKEKIGLIAQSARKNLDRLGFSKSVVNVGDGLLGWREVGPFDRVVSWVPLSEIPRPLTTQLKPQGRLVCSIIGEREVQTLTMFRDGEQISFERFYL